MWRANRDLQGKKPEHIGRVLRLTLVLRSTGTLTL